MKTRILVMVEILLVFSIFLVLRIASKSVNIVQWENQNLGWTYTVMLLFVAITALVIVLTRRKWGEYGVAGLSWPTNLDLGFKAYLVRIIPVVLGLGGAAWLGLSSMELGGGAFVAVFELIALAVMAVVLRRNQVVKSGRKNVIATFLFLLLPVGVALAMGKLNLVIVSTVVWQFLFSGFGEEFMFRGYFQSRLNQAFGRPLRLFGIQFGVGLIVASLLFGLFHAANTYDPAVGISSLAWGWALYTFVGGLFFGVIREKTGTLLAPGIAHGLPDAVGEALNQVFGWF